MVAGTSFLFDRTATRHHPYAVDALSPALFSLPAAPISLCLACLVADRTREERGWRVVGCRGGGGENSTPERRLFGI
ncbi:hypothetical protein HanRHA438_Chr11g0514691 [Helianthus annuus]|uniref:Uncharacterized protein n=1 Tax=Helianthus annuus TaxID=4232 RepID=A0A9K3HR06_HELAN|nr:hypothetical protein HanXRQr2_Chr11g0502121 [Helianthus annuus]KAJ0871630.1 hypothetical protein HanRHA438_Chr11g0514691 [Helianthus annuus]